MLTPHWKNTANDLRDRAQRVTMIAGASAWQVSAHQAAKVMSGVVRYVANEWSVDVMQRSCAALARHEASWTGTPLAALPLENGAVPFPMKLIALVGIGLLQLAGPDNVRAALSFWATEDDPGVWTSVVQS